MVAGRRDADVDAGIAAGLQFVVEPQIEVAVFLPAPEPGALLAGADSHLRFDFPTFGGVLSRPFPAGEVLATKERLIAQLGNEDVLELVLAAAGDFDLNADEAVLPLDAAFDLPG